MQICLLLNMQLLTPPQYAAIVLAAIGLLAIELSNMACCYPGSFPALLVQSQLHPVLGRYLLAPGL